MRLFSRGELSELAMPLLSETRSFSVNASRGAGECLVRTLARDEGRRYSRLSYSREVERDVYAPYWAKEWWQSDDGALVMTEVREL